MSATQPSLFDATTIAAARDVRALSLTQPWADAILDGGKRIENRLKWTGSNFRGPLLLHAAKGMTKQDYTDVWAFVAQRKIAWHPKPGPELVRGGIVGRCRVVDVIMRGGVTHPPDALQAQMMTTVRHPLAADPYYMGGFALVLADVERLPFVACSGALGFWRPPPSVLAALSVTPCAADADAGRT